jgi:hypothetical protein
VNDDGSSIRKWVETTYTDGDGKDGREDGWRPSDCCPASGPGIQCQVHGFLFTLNVSASNVTHCHLLSVAELELDISLCHQQGSFSPLKVWHP